MLIGAGAAHPAMNPYLMPANAECRTSLFARHVRPLARHPRPHGDGRDQPRAQRRRIDDIIHNIGVAARVALGGAALDEAELRERRAGRRAEVRHRRPRGGGVDWQRPGCKPGNREKKMRICSRPPPRRWSRSAHSPRPHADGLKDPKDVHIAFVVHGSASDPYWSVVKRGVDDAAELTGAKVEYYAPQVFDVVEQARLLDAAIATQPGRHRRLDRRRRRDAASGDQGRSPPASRSWCIDSGEQPGIEMGVDALRRHRLRIRLRHQGRPAAGQGRHPQGRLHQPRGRQRQPRPALPGPQRRAEAVRRRHRGGRGHARPGRHPAPPRGLPLGAPGRAGGLRDGRRAPPTR